ncbi:MAG: hypothetical protein RL021_444 [Bacteroidota bacterium]|jgi:parallel beta-helix repeat protein
MTFLLVLTATAVQAALSGTYTVGGTTPDYATPTAAAAAVVSQGVSGPVIFNIRPGTYTGKFSLTAINGTSPVNTVTFRAENGDSTSVIIEDFTGTATSDNYLLNIYGADWVTFRQLSLRRTGTTQYGTVVRIDNISVGITVENCLINGPFTTATNTNASLVFSPTGGISVDSILTIRNNILQGGSYGIHLAGANATFHEPYNVIEGNIIFDCGNRGIHLQDQRRSRVVNNTISSTANSTQFIGIYVSNVDQGSEIIGNKVSAVCGSGLAYGLQMTAVTSNATYPISVYNNFFYANSSSTAYGILLNGCVGQPANTSGQVDIFFNSTNAVGTAANAAGIALQSPVSSGVNLYNNIFFSTKLGISTGSGMFAGITSSDYNNIYGGTAVGSVDGVNAVTLSDWQSAAAKDSHSVSGDPQYVSLSDLHATSGVVSGFGTPLAGITVDIDGDTRDTLTPDIGADEFTPLADNVGPVAVLSPKNTTCGDSTVSVTVTIRNFGGAPQSNIPVTVEVTGAVTATLTETYAGPLAAGTSDTVVFTQTLNTVAGGTVGFTCFTSLTGDQDNANDTISASAVFLAIPNPPSTTAFTYCPGGDIESVTDSGFATFWFDSDTAETPLFIGNTYNPNLTADATFWVETRQSGAGGCLRITEIAQDDPSPPSGDYIEIQNISGLSFDATGWKVVASDGGSSINTINSVQWDLGLFQPGEIQYRTDNNANNYWGTNLLFNPNQNGWIMIIDQLGNIQDFVAFGWTAADIQSMSVNVAGFTITPGSQWIGDGAIACGSGVSISRTGTSDNDDANDWTCVPYTLGTQNPGLSNTFTGCGYGACASARIPVQVTTLPAITVDIGPADTTFSVAFSLTLDPGAGYASYTWSDGSTGQSITVTSAGTYWVTVTSVDGCVASDTIQVLSTVGTPDVSTEDVHVYPNPATSQFAISGLNASMGAMTVIVRDLQGREIFRTLSNVTGSDRLLIDTSGWAEGNYLLQLSGEGYSCHRTVTVSRR